MVKLSGMSIPLNLDWLMTWEPLTCEARDFIQVRMKQTNWLQTHLPCDVHMPLIEQGIITEPLLADQCFASEWTEQRSWWFKKSFVLSEEQLSFDQIRVTFEALDAEADIWLNDIYLGHHRSAFYPFSAEIKAKALLGVNQLFVRVTSGLELFSEQDIAWVHEAKVVYENEQIGKRGDNRRAMVRKPQYVYGWDWGPRVATCGIVGDVTLEFNNSIQIRDVHVSTQGIDAASANAQLSIEFELDNLHPFQTVETELELELLFGSEQIVLIQAEYCLRSGLNYITLPVEVANAKLWWPNGMGAQPLYTIRASLQLKGHRVEYPAFLFGIRKLCLNMEKLQSGIDERAFTFEINDVPVFSKGGNWIPADSIYARVSDQKYESLLKEAKEANFNMLRVWGGGIYEKDIFYEKCDEYGILIWHDFMFACAKYPDNLAWFRHEVEQEIEYQTRRLRNHCAMALWCGNNENHWGFDEWWNNTEAAEFYGGSICYNEIAPRIVKRNCPDIPYWNSSPYGGEHPNGSQSGDTHHWNDCTMNEVMEKRITPEEYDKVSAKFVSEYGYIGPCRRSSIEAYHNGQPLDRTSKVWQLHNNTFERELVLAGINKHYLNSEQLEIDDYLLYAGLCQGLMLGYSLEAIRSKPFCAGALFWMYNDCWGETGWTIIDYYLIRKISYYYVKRAFAPVLLILRQQDGLIQLTAINETSDSIKQVLEYGLIQYDGSGNQSKQLNMELPPYSRGIVLEWASEAYDPTHSCIYVKAVASSNSIELNPAILRADVFRRISIPDAQLKIDQIEIIDGKQIRFTVSSRFFAHAVHFNLDEAIRLSDEYFDLLPGEQREITVWHEGNILGADQIIPQSIHTNRGQHE